MKAAGDTVCERSPAPVPPHSDPAQPASEPALLVIERRSGWRLLDVGELWRYRELLYFLTWRDIKVRYKQTVLGAAWAILQPLATTAVFAVFLGRVAGVPADDHPYPLFVFTGMLAWTFLAAAVTNAGQSVVGSQNLVTKVYFPRVIIPMGAVGVGLVDFAIAFVMLGVMMVFYGAVPGWGVLLVPFLVLLLGLLALGVGTLLSALTVAYRDFRYVVPFGVQLWMFATPSIYMNTTGVGPRWQALLPLNPAQGLVEVFRQAILGDPIDLYSLTVSGSVSLALLLIGCLYFARVERSFADII